MTDKNKKFEERLQATKASIATKVAAMTDDELEAHALRVAEIYSNNTTANLLGDFSWDTENTYYWHTYDGNMMKLHKRIKLGYGFATREDAKRSGLTAELISDLTIDGESCIEMSHRSDRAVLLKIPTRLHKLNEDIKYRLKQNRPVTDVNGNIVKREAVASNGNNVTYKHTEPLIQIT